MKEGTRVALLISTIGVLADMITGEHTDSSQDELEDALSMLGMDAEELVRRTPLIKALQIVCKEFSEADLNREVVRQLQQHNEDIG